MNGILSLLALVAIYFIAFHLYNQSRVAEYRQRLFSIRDSLFDEACQGNIGFDSRAYTSTRVMLNGMIRFAHRVSWGRFVGYRLVSKREDGALASSMFEAFAFASASPEERALCARIIDQAHQATASHLMTSPTFYIVAAPVALMALVHYSANHAAMFVSRWRLSFRQLDDLAFREGAISIQAS